ncbi:MAG: hypothetical protein IKJ78_03090 [Bacteroidales bacterium]|nr:hypothetical protein [Bacteroidales bacterium]
MKKQYIKPGLEVFRYQPEKGYRVSVALDKDYVLIEGETDRRTLRASEEVTEVTDNDGEFERAIWL